MKPWPAMTDCRHEWVVEDADHEFIRWACYRCGATDRQPHIPAPRVPVEIPEEACE